MLFALLCVDRILYVLLNNKKMTRAEMSIMSSVSLTSGKDVEWINIVRRQGGGTTGQGDYEAEIQLQPKMWKYHGTVSKMHGKEKMTHQPIGRTEDIDAYSNKCLLSLRITTFIKRNSSSTLWFCTIDLTPAIHTKMTTFT